MLNKITATTKTLLLVLVFTFTIAVILGLIFFNTTDYWDNFWNFWPGFLGGIIAIVLFINQIEIDKSEKKKTKDDEVRKEIFQRYLDFQDDMLTNIVKLLLDFEPSLREDDSVTQNKQLASSLVTLMYYVEDGQNRRFELQRYLDNNELEDNRLLDFNDVSMQLDSIITDESNKTVVDIVRQSYPDLKASIDYRFANKIKSDQNSNKVQNDIILGSWILNKWSAQHAKYLVGVSTIDKRILGIFKITNPEYIDVDPNFENRIYFGNGTETIKSVDKDDNKNNLIMPHLDNWTARNPVLYYKQYLKSKNIDLSKEIPSIAKEFNMSVDEFEHLNDRDIIIVRTPILG